MDDWKAATETSAPFRFNTRLRITEVDGVATPIGSMLLSGIIEVESIPTGVGDTVILYGEWLSDMTDTGQTAHMLDRSRHIVVWINHHSRINAGQQQQDAHGFEVHAFGGTVAASTVEPRST